MGQRRSGAFGAALGLVAAGAIVGYAGVAGAAVQPADHLIKAIGGTQWDKPTLEIATGDTVTWDLNSGDGQPHNAVGEEGPDAGWPTHRVAPVGQVPVAPSGTGSFTFNQPGTYTYVCQVHAVMKGTITVGGSPTTPTPTPSQTATPSATASPQPTVSATPTPTATPRPATQDRTTPAPLGSARSDTTAPAITSLKLKALTRGGKVSFKLSETANVTLRVKRGKSTVKTVRGSFRAGNGSVTLRRLARGSYRIEIEARDRRGNKAAVQRKTLKVKR